MEGGDEGGDRDSQHETDRAYQSANDFVGDDFVVNDFNEGTGIVDEEEK